MKLSINSNLILVETRTSFICSLPNELIRSNGWPLQWFPALSAYTITPSQLLVSLTTSTLWSSTLHKPTVSQLVIK